ncbi:TCR/Tet family MFS transporter [Pedobacter sp. SYP-B3415]|uniref:TCR/Tet family MFS transporter n=1 Tax=Pedobacter sp. SYP-B3415 TaxID=2496641 RepID=UPI00101D214F|nr:TCR/Tet family MFS transporter [Pedobacter sp. SYP-B3415]
MKSKSNAAITFIFITMLIDFTGVGIIIPVVPTLIERLTGGGIARAADYGGWLTIAYSAMLFISAPILGGLSDRFGRRPVLLASLLGLGLDYLFLAFSPTVFWLFVGRITAGITGASFSTAQAYIADVSTPETKAQNFGLVGAAFGLGFIIGPVVGGLLSKFGVQAPFLFAAGLSLLNCLYGYFILPESLPVEKRRRFDWKRANPVGSLRHMGRYPSIAGLLGSMVLLYIAGHSVQSVWTYYTMHRFQWSETMVGYSLGFVGVAMAVIQGWLIRIIMPKLGAKRAVFIGLFLYITGFIGFGLATSGWMMFAFLVPYALAGISGPAVQGIISNVIPDNAQGELQGIMSGLMSLTAMIGPLIMTQLFSFFIDKRAPAYLPGAPFYLSAVLTLAGLLICLRSLRKYHNLKNAAIPVVPVTEH